MGLMISISTMWRVDCGRDGVGLWRARRGCGLRTNRIGPSRSNYLPQRAAYVLDLRFRER